MKMVRTPNATALKTVQLDLLAIVTNESADTVYTTGLYYIGDVVVKIRR